MKSRKIFGIIALLSVAFLLFTIPAYATNGPRNNVLIHIYYNPDVENQDLDIGILDINDWPLTSDWISKWSKTPDTIAMREYTENGLMEFDLNDQKWPTGWPGYFDPAGDAHYNASKHFRLALAYLTDKNKIVSDILKGYGIRRDTPLPPALSVYEWPGIVPYQYSIANAYAELAAGGFYYNSGNSTWGWGGTDLPKLKMYLRLDDPNRRTAGEYLVSELRAIGFTDAQLDVKITERTVCYQYVMVLYDYSVYTGGWSLGSTPDWLYDGYSSVWYFGWGAPAVGWAPNYAGWAYPVYDAWAAKVKYPATETELMYATWNATKVFWENEPIIPLWSAAAVKAYKAGSTGVVSFDGFGTDNYQTFIRMAGAAGDDGKIDYGFKSEPEAFHVISSQWLWDWNVIGLIYDGLVGRNPYKLADPEFYLATGWSVGTWDGGTKTEINFTLRTGVTWQDGDPFTADDVVFSWQFTKACGSGVAWNYASIADMNSSDIIDATHVRIRYNVLSMFASWWAGGLPIIPKHVWEARFSDWNTTSFNPSGVRTYHAWETPLDGHAGLTEEIGTGPFIIPSGGWIHGQSITLNKNTNYYLSAGDYDTLMVNSFWQYKGDASAHQTTPTDIGAISAIDGLLVRNHRTDLGRAYQAACDFDSNSAVDLVDFDLVLTNYGKVSG
jgi:peptide/nickel transport system substrate-binding protein